MLSAVRRWRRAALVAVTVLLGACGGGGESELPLSSSLQFQARSLAVDEHAGTANATISGGGANKLRPSSSLQFQAGSVAVDENNGTASVIVTRTGSSVGAVSVSVTNTDGSATASEDYIRLSTTVSFAAGDVASKKVAVPILDDPAGEADETFTLTLSAPSGATLGAITTATITIRDNDLPAAPVLSVGSTVKQLTFNWASVPGATSYRLFQDLNATSIFTQVGADHAAAATSAALDVAVHRHKWLTAQYRLEACNARGCTSSNIKNAVNAMLGAIGYFKASNTETADNLGWAVALSADGNTLAVGAGGEDSNATGVGGNQADDTARESGAVYVFARSAAGWSQQAYLKPSNADAGDNFGTSVALSADGSTLAVGASGEASSSRGINGNADDDSARGAGATYVFVSSAGVWTQQAYLKASNADAFDRFGHSVALSADGNTLAVSALEEASNATGVGGDQTNNAAPYAGAVYVFARAGGQWSQQAYLKASNADAGDDFGSSVALSGDGNTLAVGTPHEGSTLFTPFDDTGFGVGAVYVFVRFDTTWAQQQYVKAIYRENYDFFGRSIALSFDGNVLAVGVTGEDSDDTGIDGNFASNSALDAGAVYVFTRSSGVWNNLLNPVYVKASNTDAYDSFGSSVALSADGHTLAVGAPGEDSGARGINGNQADNGLEAPGAVYVFAFDDTFGMWAQQAYVKAPNRDALDYFASASIALSADGNTLAVGALFEDGNAIGIGGDQADNSTPDAGAVYLY